MVRNPDVPGSDHAAVAGLGRRRFFFPYLQRFGDRRRHMPPSPPPFGSIINRFATLTLPNKFVGWLMEVVGFR